MAAWALALTLASCAATEAPTAPPAQAPLRQDSAQIARTAGSLRQVDDLPLYEMTYYGDYDAEAPLTATELARKSDGWACSLFLRGTEFGRNFDWKPNPAMVVRAHPPGGYASLAVTDVAPVLGHPGPPDLPADRRRLAHAVLTPYDGVNEKGLAVGMAAVPDAELPPAVPGQVTVSGERLIRILLDRAATVGEAVALMRAYRVTFDGGPQIHYLIADASGASAIVEYGAAGATVVDDRILTNITMAGSSKAARMADTRYRTLAEGLPTKATSMELLRAVAQGHTRWSVVYDLKSGGAHVVTAKRWGRAHAFTLSSPG